MLILHRVVAETMLHNNTTPILHVLLPRRTPSTLSPRTLISLPLPFPAPPPRTLCPFPWPSPPMPPLSTTISPHTPLRQPHMTMTSPQRPLIHSPLIDHTCTSRYPPVRMHRLRFSLAIVSTIPTANVFAVAALGDVVLWFAADGGAADVAVPCCPCELVWAGLAGLACDS